MTRLRYLIVLSAIGSQVLTTCVFAATIRYGIAEVPCPPFYEYVKTHGEVLDSPVTPYAAEYARVQGIPLDLTQQLFSDGYPTARSDWPSPISSLIYSQGRWKFFSSKNTLVYEILKIQLTPGQEQMTVMLYNTQPSTGEYIGSRESFRGWRLATFRGSQLVRVWTLPFRCRECGGDMVYTGLFVKKGRLNAVVTYAVTGPYGSPHPGYAYQVINDKGSLRLWRTRLFGADLSP